MKVRTLVTHRRYFGVDPLTLRAAAERVMSRIAGLSPERACVNARHVKQDFGVDTIEGQMIVGEMVAEGLLRPRPESSAEYDLTELFAEFAGARVVDPLPRERAKQILAKSCALAAEINSQWARNPFEIEAVATFGSYMSRDDRLAELSLGIVVRARSSTRRARWRMSAKADGAHDIRAAFRDLSSFVRVKLVTETQKVPRPFAIAYQEDD
jgi:hypothetical protein